eukprot:snap_masked-scaffold_19-processed-gene-4.18-mRNA-1 protein AED:1.00 eAED:1.00 QI:0/0/0/0/1/1/2/0/100
MFEHLKRLISPLSSTEGRDVQNDSQHSRKVFDVTLSILFVAVWQFQMLSIASGVDVQFPETWENLLENIRRVFLLEIDLSSIPATLFFGISLILYFITGY